MKYALSLFLLCSAIKLLAQPGTVLFTGRVVDAEQKSIPGARIILVGLSEARTDDDGMFRVAVPASTVEVQVELERYEVVYPRAGRAPVPRSASTPVVFEVKKVTGNEQEKLVRQLRENVRKLETDQRFKAAEIARLEKNLQDSIRSYQHLFEASSGQNSQLLDSLQRRVQQLLSAQENTLLKQKKAQIYSNLTQTLLNFLDKAKNLRDELGRIDDVFLSDQGRSNFERQIAAYNAARDSLYNQHKSYVESVRLFWNNSSTSATMESVVDLALVQIHEGIMLPLNGSVVGPVRDAATGQAPRVAAHKKARKGAHQALQQLALPLRKLEGKINELSVLLVN